jgi:crotonobetainyl-CoA:carnitine CoA-transferase CaiB-like acyl-CoA transferase
MNKEALHGLKIADFSWSLAGPFTTKYFADHGAQVVRIESSKRPCPLRLSAPYKDGIPGINRSGYYAFYNTNKYSLALDLTNFKAIEVCKKLAAWADVVVESFTPGTMERYGLSYEELRNIKPDIIMLRCCTHGQTGPHAQHPSFGFQLVSHCGFTNLTGWPELDPQQPWGAYTDVISPRFAASALLAALLYRGKTGRGQCLDLSQFEACLQFLAPILLEYTVNGRETRRAGNYCYHAAPHGAFRCKGDDSWCVIAVFDDKQWQAFCKAMGNPEWARKPEFATLLGRKANEANLNRLVEEWTIGFTAEEVMNLLQSAGVPSGVVKNAKEVCLDPQLASRSHFWTLDHKEIGAFSHPGQAFKLSETPAEPRMSAPCLGEHTEYVCKQLLGMSDEEFDELLVSGVFE